MLRPTPRQTLVAQGAYYVATGVVPFVSRRVFERVTGPKLDWWLVQTVGALVTAVGAGLLSAVRNGRETPEVAGIAGGCAAGLAAIDLVYVARRRISPIYLVDAVIQTGLLAGSPLVRPAVRMRANEALEEERRGYEQRPTTKEHRMANPVPAGSDVSSGTYKCTNCGYELDVSSTKNLPPCPSCQNGQYETLSGGDAKDDPYPDRNS